jgi:hypothetical protein
MYCPNCAAQVDGMKFCRQCGANVSLVPQALTGQLPVTQPPATPAQFEHRSGRRGRHPRPPSIEGAAREFFTGVGFVLVALAIWQFFPGGYVWWFWLLIPAFATMGKGIGQYLSLREQQRRLPPQPSTAPTAFSAAPPQPPFSAPTTAELRLPESAAPPPASITEHTTALLERERAQSKEQA